MSRERWEKLGGRDSPSWYLDPLAARQKREAHLSLVRRWAGSVPAPRMLKTDLFEDAFGEDQLVEALAPHTGVLSGMDLAFSTARAAADRWRSHNLLATVMDVRELAWKTGAFDVVLSTSTLDHFDERGEFVKSLRELARVLRAGGLLILTLDNARNPLYPPLRWASRLGLAPFRLGYTPGVGRLERDLHEAGLLVERREWLLHNPRMISTMLFLGARRLLGRGAGGVVGASLRAFDLLGRLPTRSLTACFVAVAARKPAGEPWHPPLPIETMPSRGVGDGPCGNPGAPAVSDISGSCSRSLLGRGARARAPPGPSVSSGGAGSGPPALEELIVEPRRGIADREPEDEGVAESDQAADEGDPVG